MPKKFLSIFAFAFLCIAANAQFDARIRDFVQDELRKGAPYYGISDYTRFVPPVFHMGLGLTGVPSRHALVDRTIEEAIAYTCAVSAGYLLKYTVHRVRPDASDNKSFPSGHALFAFTGAELTRMDYGWGWGAGAYATAAFTGAERLWGDGHWFTDVLAGAGIGILSAHVGGWLLQPVKDLFGIPEIDWDGPWGRKASIAFAPLANPFNATYAASLAVAF